MLCEYEYDANGGANGRYEAARSKSNGADYAHDNEHNGQDNFNDFPSTQFCHRLTSSTCSGNSISYAQSAKSCTKGSTHAGYKSGDDGKGTKRVAICEVAICFRSIHLMQRAAP